MPEADIEASAAPAETAPAETAPAETAEPAVPTDAEPVERSVLDVDLPAGMQTFDREYVERSRQEAGKYRQQARDANERIAELEGRYKPFDAIPDADRDTWINLMDGWANNPQTAAADFRRIADSVLGDPTATPTEKAEAEAVIEKVDTMTPENVQTMMTETLNKRDVAARQSADIAKVHAQIAEAGFPEGTSKNFEILWIANNDPAADGDIGKAIDIVKAEKQQVIDDYVSGVRDGGNPTPAPAGGLPANATPTEITTMEGAGKAAREWLKNRERTQ